MTIQNGDIVQITNDIHPWYTTLVVVDEVKHWGITGYAIIPNNEAVDNGHAFTRLDNDDFIKVGTARVVVRLNE